MNIHSIWELIKKTISGWQEDKAPWLAAAMAYYTAFSLAPILIIAIAVVGFFYQQKPAQELVTKQIESLAGFQSGQLLRSMVAASQDMGSNLVATIIGVIALLLGATGVYGQLQGALDTIWEVAPKPNQGIVRMVEQRFFSLAIVFGIGFLLLVSLVISAFLSALNTWSLGLLPNFKIVLQVLNFLVSLLVITFLFALIFKYVPDAKIQWRDVWPGALVTALLFTVGKTLIGLYLGNSRILDQFGAAGSLAVILIWVYYSAQISFLGAEFTQVYANTFGSHVVPDEDAIPITKEARLEQGMPRRSDLESANQKGISVLEAASSSANITFGTERGLNAGEAARRKTALIAFAWLITTLAGLLGGYFLGLGVRKEND